MGSVTSLQSQHSIRRLFEAAKALPEGHVLAEDAWPTEVLRRLRRVLRPSKLANKHAALAAIDKTLNLRNCTLLLIKP